MKQVIDLEGNEISVANTTVVKTVNGIHYILTPEDDLEVTQKEEQYQAEQADYLANHKYKDDRKKAYGSIEDQLDMVYWDQVNGTTTFKDHITIVKESNPKPV